MQESNRVTAGGGARRLRACATLTVLALVSVACGLRASPELLDAAKQAELNPPAAGGPQFDQRAPTAVDQQSTSTSDNRVDTPLTPIESGTQASPGAGVPAEVSTNTPTGGSQQAGEVDTRFAPPGGNGGATDVGVTETEILVGNVADITGAVAGLFADVQKAVQAYELFFNSTEGTIYWRTVRVQPMDTGLTRTGNFNAYTELCDSAFMAVGSMSAFDEGIHDPVTKCEFPDLRTTSTNPSIMLLPTVYSTLAIRPDTLALTPYQYWKAQFPEAIKSAGFVFVDNNTTRAQTAAEVDGSSQIGFEWTAYEPVDLAALSYKTQIRSMKNADPPVRFVAFQGAYQQAAKLAREMVEEDFIPDVYALQMNIYDPRFLVEGGANLEEFPVQIALLSQMTEEIEGSPELQTYRKWLKFIDPEAEPTGLGNYAWSATKLAYSLLKQIGPNLTREKMVEAMSQVTGWTADGLTPAQEVGERQRANCVIMLEIQDAAFRRVHPAEPNTFDCSGPVVTID